MGPELFGSILLVEDEASIREHVAALLEQHGLAVSTAEDGAAALDQLAEQCYELALVDVHLPNVGGLELLARMRQTCPHIGVVMLTDEADPRSAVEAMRCGALDVVPKPVTDNVLLTTVRRALSANEKRVHEQLTPRPEAPNPADMAPAAIAATIAHKTTLTKATLPWINVTILGMLAGAYIGFAAMAATLILVDAADHVGFGLARILAGLIFSVGLILVVLAGAELFTGNNLMVTGALRGQVGAGPMLLRWLVVWLANFAGALIVVWLVYAGGVWKLDDAALGATALKIASAKAGLPPFQAFVSGIGCNWLVCLAVWMATAARHVSGKILAICFPITVFVAAGFEHCVANQYFLPMGMFLSTNAQVLAKAHLDLTNLTWANCFLHNLFPVTLGNIVGGGLFVGVLYWAAYLRRVEAN